MKERRKKARKKKRKQEEEEEDEEDRGTRLFLWSCVGADRAPCFNYVHEEDVSIGHLLQSKEYR